MMKKTIFPAVASLLLLAACNGGGSDTVEIDQLRDEAIAIHDEIMPQISAFDRNTVKIDSLLSSLPELKAANPDIDTAQVRTDLSGLKERLEGATNAMMDWMTGFDVDPQDKSATEIKTYYEKEVEKVKEMKIIFDEAARESTEKLAQF
ncbi:transposase [Parapedobacter sp. 10938]|uniref:transposase n=1 Tax=Parapedobacter flavus TaxID=3110225 RepID=UPI002DBCCDFF|nr:transposase [Parapedobacter sp. 10938]MEC3880357.1 transposase [Parapedobacter sp. 10938]